MQFQGRAEAGDRVMTFGVEGADKWEAASRMPQVIRDWAIYNDATITLAEILPRSIRKRSARVD